MLARNNPRMDLVRETRFNRMLFKAFIAPEKATRHCRCNYQHIEQGATYDGACEYL